MCNALMPKEIGLGGGAGGGHGAVVHPEAYSLPVGLQQSGRRSAHKQTRRW